MRKFVIPVSWEVCGIITVEAKTLEEAVKLFDEKELSDDPHILPRDGEYADGSFKRESLEIIQLAN